MIFVPVKSVAISKRVDTMLLLVVFAVLHNFAVQLADCIMLDEKAMDTTPMEIKVVAHSLAMLPCTVDPMLMSQYPDKFQVIWTSPQKVAITISDRRILNDERISVERPFRKDWTLHIRNVSKEDEGVYKCQLNTKNIQTKKVRLIVHEPPRIVQFTYPTEISAMEGQKISLFCNATGSPEPEIYWYRLNVNSPLGRLNATRVGETGDQLLIHNITRDCADTYKCVADNGVVPAISQLFKVKVHYPPKVTLANTRLAQAQGKETVLECDVTAAPLGAIEWLHNGRRIKDKALGSHYDTVLYNRNDEMVILTLRISKIQAEHYGQYTCEASNQMGTTTQSMELYELHPKTTTTTTTTTEKPAEVWPKSDQLSKEDYHRVPEVHDGYSDPNTHATAGNTYRTQNGDPGVDGRFTGAASASSKDTKNGASHVLSTSTSHNILMIFALALTLYVCPTVGTK